MCLVFFFLLIYLGLFLRYDFQTKLYSWKIMISSKESVVRRPHFLELGLFCVCSGPEGGKHSFFLEVLLCTQKISKSAARQLLSGCEYVK